MIYAVEAFNETIVYTKGDVAPLAIEIYCNGVAYNMTGTLIEIDIKDKAGTVIQSLSTATGEIVIDNSELTITPAAFTVTGNYKFDIQQTVGGYIYTIGKGTWTVQKEIT